VDNCGSISVFQCIEQNNLCANGFSVALMIDCSR